MFIIKPNNPATFKVDPITKVSTFTGFTDKVIGENSSTQLVRTFRWSTDDINYSDWVELNESNLTCIEPVSDNIYYIEINYALSSGEVVLEDFDLSYNNTSEGYVKKISKSCCSVSRAPILVSNTCNPKKIFDPNDLSKSYDLTNQLNNFITAQRGHCVTYYLTGSVESSRDVILKEYSLYNIQKVENINIVVPDNEFPDNAPNFTALDMEFLEMAWEVQIAVGEWCRVFGDDVTPKRQDVIYFPITNRVYEIESSYLYKDYVSRGTYWKLNLIKYQEKANRNFEEEILEDIKSSFDELTVSTEDKFIEERNEDIEKIVKEPQYEVISTNGYDSTRESINSNLDIIRKNLENNYTVFAKYHYDMRITDRFVNPAGVVAVNYFHKPVLEESSELSLTFWANLTQQRSTKNSNITSTLPLANGNTKLTVDDISDFEVGSIISIKGINSIKGLHTIVSIEESSIVIDKSTNSNYSNLSGVTIETVNPNWVINGYSEELNSGIKIGITKFGVLVAINSTIHTFNLNLTEDEWYGVVINLSNKFKQLSCFMYTRSTERSSKLNKNYAKTVKIQSEVFTVDAGYTLKGADLLFTNLRLFNTSIEEEYHSLILSQYIVKDNHLAHIIDNAVCPLELSRTKQTK